MAVLVRAPRLALRAPRGRPGDDFTVTLTIDAADALELGGVRVRLSGRERATTRELTDTHTLLELETTVPLATLPTGRHQVRVSFALPPTLPPSHDGRVLDILYVVEARVIVRRWTDTVAAWTVFIDAPPGPLSRPGLPQSAASTRPERTPDDPLLEISLGASVVAGGDVVTGALALSNLPAGAQRGCELALIAQERPRIADDDDPEVQRFAFPPLPPISAGKDGQPVPFELTLPRGLTPTFKARLGALTWFIEARAYTDLGNLVARMPVQVVAAQGPAPAPARVAAPVIGSERVRSLWDKVASQLGLEHRDGELRGSIAGCMLTVRQGRRGARRQLVGELTPRSLRLGLHVEPRRALFRAARGLRPDDRGGDDPGYAIHARERAQALALLQALAPVLRRLPEASLGDEHARFVLPDAGHNEARLIEFTTTLHELARALADARLAVPPPVKMADHVLAWRALATTLDGSLDSADMSITGRLRGLDVAVRADWSDGWSDPGLTLEITMAHTMAEQWHSSRIPTSAAELPPAGLAQLARAVADASDATWTIAGHSLALHLGDAPADPRPLLPRLDTLSELALLLRDQSSPYR